MTIVFRNPTLRTLMLFIEVGLVSIFMTYIFFVGEKILEEESWRVPYKKCTQTVQNLYIKCTKIILHCTKYVHELYKKCTLVYKNCTQSVQKWYTEKVKVQFLYGKVQILYAKVQILVPLIYTFLKRSFARLASEAKLRVYNIYNIYRRSRKK